jgi:hypothetical protein
VTDNTAHNKEKFLEAIRGTGNPRALAVLAITLSGCPDTLPEDVCNKLGLPLGEKFSQLAGALKKPQPLLAVPALAAALPRSPASGLSKHVSRQQRKAIAFLTAQLVTGPKSRAEVMQAAKRVGVARYAVEQASNLLNIVKRPSGFRGAWLWEFTQ